MKKSGQSFLCNPDAMRSGYMKNMIISALIEAFDIFDDMIKTHWKKHDTLIGFAMDHGCHEIDGD